MTPRPTPRWRVAVAALPLLAAAPVLAARADAAPATPPRVTAYPSPGASAVSAKTEISFRGVAPSRVGALTVRGSSTGVHAGALRAHGDGRGASFVPSKPFRDGEKVTVTTALPVVGTRGGQITYTVARSAPQSTIPLPTAPGAPAVLSYRSTDVHPLATTETAAATRTVPGLTFTAPYGPPDVQGLQIMDDRNQVVYFQPLAQRAFDFKVQRYQGKPVLTWFEGSVVLPGYGTGSYVIADTSYRVIKRVRALGGLNGDLHEFTITPQGTALITSYNPIYRDARTSGGVVNARVLDNVVQEIDLASGRLLFEWHAVDHIGLTESYLAVPKDGTTLFDFAHVNSVKQFGSDGFAISVRSAHAVLTVDRSTGAITHRIGGKRGNFRILGSKGFSSQHDATLRSDGNLTLFDNALGTGESSATTSRGLILRVDLAKRTATLVRDLTPATPLPAQSQGSIQALAVGNTFVNFGSAGSYQEYAADGTLVHGVSYAQRGVQTYRAYKSGWTATPTTLPAAAAAKDANGTAVFASWNGATEVASWRVLGATSAGGPLVTVGSGARTNFETTLRAPAGLAAAAVQALGSSGAVLGTSPTVPVS